MATPEGKVKESVRQALRRMQAYWHMPVQNGMGKPSLDFHVCVPIEITEDMVGLRLGLYVGVETKKLGGKPTPRQVNTMAEIAAAGGRTFVIDGDTSELENWSPDELEPSARSQRDGGHRESES